MKKSDWQNASSKSFGLMYSAATGERLLLLANAHHEEQTWSLPASRGIVRWRLLVDTARGLIEPGEPEVPAKGSIGLPGRSVLLWEARSR